MNSILQDEKACYLTGKTDNLHKHHIYPGKNRKASDKWGCWCWLSAEMHTGGYGVHQNPKALQALQRVCQIAFEQTYSHELFMLTFGKNYI